MPQIVNTNIASINAQRNLNKSQGALQTSLQRLSSGLRINSAKDDAAGLAISNRFTTQVRGLNIAVRNANDGISYAQTAEGALGEVTGNLQRIRDLAVQSANDTNSDSDRQSLQEEVNQLVSEINRIAETTSFNGSKVLNGSKEKLNFHIGADANQTVSVQGMDARASRLGSQPGMVQSTGNRVNIQAAADAGNQGIQEDSGGNGATDVTDFSIRVASVASGDEVNLASARFGGNIESVSTDELQDRFSSNYGAGLAKSLAARINDVRKSGEATMQGVYATAVTTFRGSDLTSNDMASTTVDANSTASNVGIGELRSGDLTINGVDIGAVKFEVDDASGSLVNAINAKSDVTGVQAAVDRNGELVLTAGDGRDIVIDTSNAQVTNDLFGGGDELATDRFSGNVTDLRVSGRLTITGNDTISFGGNDAATAALDANGLAAAGSETNVQAVGTIGNADITTVESANMTIKSVDSALSQIDSFRATLGAVQNRLDSTIRNLSGVSESLSAANSRILDADFASETASLAKNQVLQQAGISVLAQANALPQSALSLLG
jgi:flagellin